LHVIDIEYLVGPHRPHVDCVRFRPAVTWQLIVRMRPLHLN
jgi:hypothetical protein